MDGVALGTLLGLSLTVFIVPILWFRGHDNFGSSRYLALFVLAFRTRAVLLLRPGAIAVLLYQIPDESAVCIFRRRLLAFSAGGNQLSVLSPCLCPIPRSQALYSGIVFQQHHDISDGGLGQNRSARPVAAIE